MKWVLLVWIGLSSTCGCRETRAPEGSEPSEAGPPRWLGAWASAPQLVEEGEGHGSDNRPPNPPGLANNTLRQIVFPTIGGEKVRLELSNRWGTTPLEVRSVHLAHANDVGGIEPVSDTQVTFDGNSTVTLKPGATLWSDAVRFTMKALSKTAITMSFGSRVPVEYTGHPGSRTDSYIQMGDAVSAPLLLHAVKTEHWYYLTKIDVETKSARSGAVVAFGDSITDGRGSTSSGTNLDQRWTDHLARKLQSTPATQSISVLNLGIGGNVVNGQGRGPSGMERFERDVLAQSGVKWVIVLHGINDISRRGSAAVEPLLAAYASFVERAHARGIKVFGVPLLPFGGSRPGANQANVEAHRVVNDWIRAKGHFDAVIDFEGAVCDRANPTRLKASHEQDGLHPTAELYRAMADSIDTTLFH